MNLTLKQKYSYYSDMKLKNIIPFFQLSQKTYVIYVVKVYVYVILLYHRIQQS